MVRAPYILNEETSILFIPENVHTGTVFLHDVSNHIRSHTEGSRFHLRLRLPIILAQRSSQYSSPLTAQSLEKILMILKHGLRFGVGKQ